MSTGRRRRGGLRVLQVSAADVRGGAEQVGWNLFRAVRARGHASWLAVGEKWTDDPDVLLVPNKDARGSWSRFWRGVAAGLQPAAETSRAAAVLRRGAGALADPGARLDYYRGREDFRFPGTAGLLDATPETPDVIHAHNLHGGYFDLRLLPRLSRQVPLVLTLHDAWLLSGHCAHSFGCDRWQTGCGRCPDLSIYPAVRRDATAANWRRKRAIFAGMRLRVAAPSRWLLARVEQSLLAPALVESRLIPNGIDLSIFHPGDRRAARAALGLSLDAPLVLAAGIDANRNPWKDFATLEAAVGALAGSTPAVDVVVVGADSGETLPDRASMRFVPLQRDPATLAAYYRAADVYVHATRADTFPLTVLESLASGTPVVASAVGGIPEQVEAGRSGLLVPPRDPLALAAAVRRLLDDEELRARQGEEAARRARERFGLERQVDAYLEWYAELAESAPPRTPA